MSTFVAKYDGTCGVCGFSIEKKEICHYVHDKIAHENCHEVDGSDFSSDGNFDMGNSDTVTTTYRVKGRRDIPYCTTCFTYHRGDCV